MCGGGISLWREWRIANSEWRIVSGERCFAIHPFTTDHSLTYHSLFAIRYSPLNNPLPGLGDFLDAPDPLLDLAVAGLDQHVVGTGIAISGKAGAEFARVLAVPGGTQRNREWGGALRAQASDDRRRLVGRQARAMPAVAQFHRARERRLGGAADPDRDRRWLGFHAHVGDLRGDVFGREAHRVIAPERAHERSEEHTSEL